MGLLKDGKGRRRWVVNEREENTFFLCSTRFSLLHLKVWRDDVPLFCQKKDLEGWTELKEKRALCIRITTTWQYIIKVLFSNRHITSR